MRVGIIGGGIAGLTTAWLLDESVGAGIDAITLLEREHRLGGHAESVPVDDGFADLGAQHLAPDAFPVHTRLLRRLGLDEGLIESPLSVTVTSGTAPVVTTPHPRLRPQPTGAAGNADLGHLNTFLARAAELEQDPDAWYTPVGEIVEPLDIPDRFKREAVYPLLASFVGCSLEATRDLSFRAAVAFLVRNSPESPGQPPPWRNLDGGLGGLADSLAERLRNTRIRKGASVTRMRRTEHGHEITDSTGGTETVDHVVFATPPDTARRLAADSADPELDGVLRRFDFVRSVVGVHRDPTYVPSEPGLRSTNNITVSERHRGTRWAETSTWYGPITGAQVFKSWLTHRDRLPTELVTAREYHHPVPTVRNMRAQAVLEEIQGNDGLHCAGSWTVDVDSQESAVRSAVATARRILPSAQRIKALDDER
ncbi:putative NAD/FAD-binding protein [Actinopolyspora biskrensis]|uniref:Putative NAD/FAD-binding protein n=1 Tax=Actinopolyspora biskrensis TaxID=1470178 RepID=A0A852Z250_9ACTN|nr:putative NAD/FAD-binding protein [Actinopolyspora biskrensis]